MEKSNFRDWTLDKIEDVFGLKEVEILPELAAWLAYHRSLVGSLGHQ